MAIAVVVGTLSRGRWVSFELRLGLGHRVRSSETVQVGVWVRDALPGARRPTRVQCLITAMATKVSKSLSNHQI